MRGRDALYSAEEEEGASVLRALHDGALYADSNVSIAQLGIRDGMGLRGSRSDVADDAGAPACHSPRVLSHSQRCPALSSYVFRPQCPAAVGCQERGRTAEMISACLVDARNFSTYSAQRAAEDSLQPLLAGHAADGDHSVQPTTRKVIAQVRA